MIQSSEEVEPRHSDLFVQNNHRVPRSHQEWKNYQALKRAIRHGRKEEAERLLAEKVPIDVHFDYSKGYLLVTPLHLAVYHDHLDLIKILLDQGASVNARDATDETPLMLSVRLRKYSITDLLLTADSLDNLWDDHDQLGHLHIACLRNNVSAVKKLIALGADVNEDVCKDFPVWEDYTPLHFAVECHGVEIVKLLVDNGADVMSKNARSMTPLHLAQELRNEEIIDILLAAQMFKLGNPADKQNLSHFHIACTRNNVRFVEHFLNQGEYIESEVDRRFGRWSHYRPLTFAIYYECPDVVELLLKEGAKSWNFDLEEDGYLGLAYEIGNEEIIRVLHNNRAIKSRTYPQRKLLSKFQLACMKGDLKKIERLLSSRKEKVIAELDLSSWNEVTPLHFLVQNLSREMIESLQNFGANFSAQDARGLTPLHILFKKSRCRESFPSNLFDPKMNPSDNYGLTHFHIACTSNDVKLIAKFVENGVNIDDAVSSESLKWSGFTALHFAVAYQKPSAVQYLLESGAKISLKNGNGLSPFDLAIIYLHEDLSHYSDEEEKFEIVRKFLVEGEKFGSDFDRRGFSLLHILAITKEEFDNAYFSSCLEKLPDGINQTVNFPKSEYHGCTALHFAMRVDNREVSRWLVERGADIHLKDNSGFSPLQYEIDSRGSFGFLEENPEILCVPGNPFAGCGNSYFHIGCLVENRRIMEFYVTSGVDINVRTIIGLNGRYAAETPLHTIVRQPETNVIETMEFLINHGANVNERDAFVNTPLHCMDSQMKRGMVEFLLTHGAEVNAQNIHGNTPLYLACYNGMSSKIVALLLDHGADINIENDEGYTPLSYVGDLLMNAGASDKNVLVLVKHVKKLMLLGLYVSDKNEKMLDELVESYTFSTFDETKFEDECFKEMRMMRDCRINQYTTVCSIISKSLNEMAYISQNSSFQEFIDSEYFVSNFPIYGYLIKLQYKRGLVRKPLLETCKLAFNSVAQLSSESVERILDYLDDEDLKSMIKSQNVTPKT